MNVFNYSISKGKPEENEDALRVEEALLAISDGAGGAGVFAQEWAQMLVSELPKNEAFKSMEDFKTWYHATCQKFLGGRSEKVAHANDFVKQKWEKEGSYATLAAVWFVDNKAYYCAYGDTIVFHYSNEKNLLSHTAPQKLETFLRPPVLLNPQQEIQETYLHIGTFSCQPQDVLFIASDALAGYLMTTYYLSQYETDKEARSQIDLLLASPHRFAQFVENLYRLEFQKLNFHKDILNYWLTQEKANVEEHLRLLQKHMLLEHDDVTFIGVCHEATPTTLLNR